VIVLDVNAMVASLRDDHVHHVPVRSWLDELILGDEPFAIPGLVAVGMVMEQRAYTESPHGSDVHEVFRSICLSGQVGGNLVTDAWIAACALSVGASVATMDRDFRRFDALRIVDPSSKARPGR